jgi:hypothetical protein
MSRFGLTWVFAKLIGFLLNEIGRAVPSALIGLMRQTRLSAVVRIVPELRDD